MIFLFSYGKIMNINLLTYLAYDTSKSISTIFYIDFHLHEMITTLRVLMNQMMKSQIPITLLLLSLTTVLPSCRQSTESGIFFGDPVISAAEDPVKLLFPGNWADPSVVKVDNIYYLTSNNGQYVPSSPGLSEHGSQALGTPLLCQSNGRTGSCDGHYSSRRTPIHIWWMAVWIPGSCMLIHPMKSGLKGSTWNLWQIIQLMRVMSWTWKEIATSIWLTGKMVKLSGDGLSAQTAPEKVYDGWEIPDEIAIECVCLESPKFFHKDDWYYMVSATGGTAGPSTSHMAIVARAQTPNGPWENSPYNPMIWTRDESEPWWSKGHATLIEGPEQEWFAIYHGYRHGQRSWGRSTLISPVEWNNDGWPLLASKWPGGWDDPLTMNLPLSDEFDGEKIGMQWQAYEKLDTNRYKLLDDAIEIMAIEGDPGYSNPLTVNPRDLAYEVETEMVMEGEIHAGLILFYSPDAYITLGLTPDSTLLKNKHSFQAGQGQHLSGDNIPYTEKRIRLKIRNDRQDASFYYSMPDEEWIKLERSDDVSGFQHNVHGGFSSIRPGFFATGNGKARFEYFRYTALPLQE